MNKLHNPKLSGNAQRLRREMTKEERRLWYDFLKTLPVTVHRQKVLGPYIVDFYIAAAKIIIELDGSQHYENLGKTKDEERDAWLKNEGYQVLRYANTDVNRRFQSVCQDIANHLRIYTDCDTSSDLASSATFSSRRRLARVLAILEVLW